MPITHVNAKGKTYYLHQGTTKTGKPKYHFAMKSEGALVQSIPEGFEIYENPNAQVFLRRIPPKIITDEERQLVEDGMRKYASVKDYKIDVRGKAIEIHTAHWRTFACQVANDLSYPWLISKRLISNPQITSCCMTIQYGS